MNEYPTRILCVDDHAFLVDGLRARLEMERDMEFVGHLPDADRLIPELNRLKPDIVLLDIEMPGPDPFEAADDVRRFAPDTKVVFLSAYIRDHYLSAAFKAGAWGYFSKSDEPAEIIAGLRKVAAGEFTLTPKVAERCKPAAPAQEGAPPCFETGKSKLELLTSRELEVLRLIGRGMTRNEIADALCRSPKTVDGHRDRIMTKLDIHTGAELVRFAIREGLVEP